MALEIKEIDREFRIEESGVVISDPNPEMTVENVQLFYSSLYPELTTATVKGPEYKDDKYVYIFTSVIGTKG